MIQSKEKVRKAHGLIHLNMGFIRNIFVKLGLLKPKIMYADIDDGFTKYDTTNAQFEIIEDNDDKPNSVKTEWKNSYSRKWDKEEGGAETYKWR